MCQQDVLALRVQVPCPSSPWSCDSAWAVRWWGSYLLQHLVWRFRGWRGARMETRGSWRGPGPWGCPALWGLRPPGTPACGFPPWGRQTGRLQLPLSCPGRWEERAQGVLPPGPLANGLSVFRLQLPGVYKRIVKGLPLTTPGWLSRQQ